MSKKVLILSGSPRKSGNSDLLCDEFMRGALESGNEAEKIRVAGKHIAPCSGCYYCSAHNGEVGKPAVFCCTVPMFDTRGNIYYIAGQKKLRFFTPFLIITFSSDTDENLPSAFCCIVDMPVISTRRFKSNIVNADLLF